MREAALPVEFSALAGKVSYVQRVTAGEWSSSCPQCRGTPHRNEFPDRFRMWTNATGKNKVMGWCRKCGYVWFPDGDRPMKPHEFEQWRKDALAAEEKRKAEAERAIQLLKSEKVWQYYHESLNQWARDVIKSWGIYPEWADFWELGLYADYTCYNRQDGEYHTPAITIPIWQQDWDLRNIKVRTLNPKREGDRYRSLYKVGADFPFVALPDLKSDTVLVTEGEKKAMVTAQYVNNAMQVVGVPSKTPSAEALRVLDNYGKIFLCLDPDARKQEKNGVSPLKRMVDLLGKERVLVVNLPDKVDDMIVQNGLKISEALRYARPA